MRDEYEKSKLLTGFMQSESACDRCKVLLEKYRPGETINLNRMNSANWMESKSHNVSKNTGAHLYRLKHCADRSRDCSSSQLSPH